MSSRSARALLVVLGLMLVVGPAAGFESARPADGLAATDGPEAVAPAGGAAALSQHNGTLAPPEQVLRVELRPDGNARWHVSARFPIETRNDTAAFQDLAAEFEAGETNQLALEAFEVAAARAGNETDRSMRIGNVSRTHRVEDDTGVLTLSFTWTNFAERSGDRLIVGDAFNTTSGTWLPYLTERQTLLIAPPEEYGVRSSPPVAVEDGVARWDGPTEFDGRDPWIVYAGDAGTETPPTTTPPNTSGTPPGPDNSSTLLLLVAVVGGGVAIIGAYVLRRGPDGVPGTDGGSSPGSDGGGADAGGASADGTAPPESPAETGSGPDRAASDDAGAGPDDEAAGASAETPAADATDDGEDEVDVALLSDEERVERLLEQNGGRMKQASIVKETGWSNAKVSQLLSSMDENGRVDKLRIGRENLISFPDEDVTDLDSE